MEGGPLLKGKRYARGKDTLKGRAWDKAERRKGRLPLYLLGTFWKGSTHYSLQNRLSSEAAINQVSGRMGAWFVPACDKLIVDARLGQDLEPVQMDRVTG